MSTGIQRSGSQLYVGDYLGCCSDSPSHTYTLGWYCAKSKGRMDYKHYVLLQGSTPIVWGEMASRIYEGKVSEVGRFALHLIGKTNQSTVRLFESNGQEFAAKQFRDGLLFFDLSADGLWLFWTLGDELHALDLSTMEQSFEFRIEPRFYATGAQMSPDGATVMLQHGNKEWYRFERSGNFPDKEKWMLDFIQTCDGASLYLVIDELYRKQGTSDGNEAGTYAQWIEEAIRRGIKESHHLKISAVYAFLAQLYAAAGDTEKQAQANASAEQHLDGFTLVDRATSRAKEIGDPPNQALARRVIEDLDRASATPRVMEYPDYSSKLYRTKGEVFEILGNTESAIEAYKKALEANPQAGCKKQLERLVKGPVTIPEKPRPKPVELKISLDKVTMFHFRCPLCSATPKEKSMQDYLADWQLGDLVRLDRLFSVLLAATKELKTSRAHSAKRFLAAADELIASLSERVESPQPGQPALLISAAEKTMVIQTECPICRKPPGLRRKDNYFTVWSEACRVQSSNLYYEIGVILKGLCTMSPGWLDSGSRQFCDTIRSKAFRAGETIGLMSCPRCGRFTTCLFGGSKSDPEKGMCRWCLDASETNQITINLNLFQ